MVAERAGYGTNCANDSAGPVAMNMEQADGKTRDEVEAELLVARPFSASNSDDHDYPVTQVSSYRPIRPDESLTLRSKETCCVAATVL